MRKKFLLTVLVVGGAILVVGNTQARWHVKRAVNWATDGVRGAIPIEYQLKEAEDLIQELDPQIDSCRRGVVEEQVAIESLDREIRELENRLENQARVIQARNEELKANGSTFVVAGRSYSRNAMAAQVSRALERHRMDTALLKQKHALLSARQKAALAAEQKLEAVRTERSKLDVAVQELRAKLLETQAMEALSRRTHLEDGRLGEVKEILERVRTRLDVTRKMILSEESVLEILPEDDGPALEDVSNEVDLYFGHTGAQSAALVPACR